MYQINEVKYNGTHKGKTVRDTNINIIYKKTFQTSMYKSNSKIHSNNNDNNNNVIDNNNNQHDT